MSTHAQPLSSKGCSVHEDWCAWLSADKSPVYNLYTEQLEATYRMLSVSLDEAMALQRSGQVMKSYQAVSVTPSLCTRLTELLLSILRTLSDHGKHYGIVPNASPLEQSNFRGLREQRSAKRNELLSRVLLTERSQFLHKLGSLEEMVDAIAKDFRAVSEDLAKGASCQPEADWQTLDDGHFDLNTCLRETVVLLKCFLLVLPKDQLGSFQRAVAVHQRSFVPDVSTGQRTVRHRRMSSIAGQ